MTAPDPDLREGLADVLADELRAMGVEYPYQDAATLIAGPLAAILAKAESAERVAAVLEKHEPRLRTDALRPDLETLDERVAFACLEAIDSREGERRLAERAGITLGVTAVDDPAALIDGLRAAAVRIARLSAEVEALRFALAPFAAAADRTEAQHGDQIPDHWSAVLSFGLCREARAALARATDQPGEPALPAEAAAQEGPKHA